MPFDDCLETDQTGLLPAFESKASFPFRPVHPWTLAIGELDTRSLYAAYGPDGSGRNIAPLMLWHKPQANTL